MAKIQLNGKRINIKSNFSIFDLLKNISSTKECSYRTKWKNCSKITFKKKYLKNNDKIEIVHFIGGG